MSPSVIILTGQSGSGISTAIRALEDQGVYCVDNVPPSLASQVIAVVHAEGIAERVALGLDVRSRRLLEHVPGLIHQLREGPHAVRVLYLEAKEEALIRRYSETRRCHPLDSGHQDGLHQVIQAERQLLSTLQELADDILDTTGFTPHELRARIAEQVAGVDPEGELKISLVSFGFKHGIPHEADMMFDVRFVQNPYFEPSMRELDGRTEAVQKFVLDRPQTRGFLDKASGLIASLIPEYRKARRHYLCVAVGCTGGQHRSVAIAESLQQRLAEQGVRVDLRHRDVPNHDWGSRGGAS